ncbi:von Willebrand factor A domain-containing protein 5A-like [Etheostoma cragini]|uniref:von Willebrand factor A domain-containing protein 5A-like n=1 Tax=Etheostoma cragini TaxID=417921 RepID=UPI00155E8A16|nr:von Willebrand factor A domain-containing protein 5A-like [Etheostoma cragini]
MEESESRGEQEEGLKKKVVELSVQSGVSSAFTAFIAVNKGDGEVIQGPLVLRNVPVPRMMACYMAMPQCRQSIHPVMNDKKASSSLRSASSRPPKSNCE